MRLCTRNRETPGRCLPLRPDTDPAKKSPAGSLILRSLLDLGTGRPSWEEGDRFIQNSDELTNDTLPANSILKNGVIAQNIHNLILYARHSTEA